MAEASAKKKSAGPDIGLNTDSENLAKFQAIALSNRLTSLKRYNTTLVQKNQSLESETNFYREFLDGFQGSWQNFLQRVKSTHILLQKDEDNQHAKKFNAVGIALPKLLQDVLQSKPNKELQEKNTRALESFFEDFADIYSGLRTSCRAVEEMWSKINEKSLASEVNDVLAKENQELKRKIKETDNQNMSILSMLSQTQQKKPSNSEFERNKAMLKSLEEDLQSAREHNENLNRRLKYIIKNHMVWNTNDLDTEDADTKKEIDQGCTCGGKFFEELFAGIKDAPRFYPQNTIETENEAGQQAQGGTKDDIDEEKRQEEKAKQAEYLSLQERIQQLEKQAEELLESKSRLAEENARYKTDLENIEEKVFSSKLFGGLVSQTQEVLRMCIYLRSRVQSANNSLDEYDEQRRTELNKLASEFAIDQGEIGAILQRLKQALEIANNRIGQKENELLQELELNARVNNLMKLIDENDRRYENLNKENVLLRSETKDLKERLEKAETKLSGLETSNNALSGENFALKQKVPDFVWDEVVFRHQKHKEFLAELHGLNKKHQLGIKEHVDDMRHYIKSREEKIDILEKKLKRLGEEREKEKKQAAQMIQEMDLNSKISEDLMQKANQLTSQISGQTENISKLVKERHLEKYNFELEKNSFTSKFRSKEEECVQLKKLIEELKSRGAQQESFQKTQDEAIALQKTLLNENRAAHEELLKKIEELKTDVALQKDKIRILEKNDALRIREFEATKLKLAEKQDFIDRKLARARDVAKDGTIDLTAEDIDFLKLEVKRYRRMLTCSVCSTNERSVVLNRCFHTFCKKCIDMNLQVRDRKCPTCRTKFDTNNVQKLWME